MDGHRAEVCVGWWTTRGGREGVLGSEEMRVNRADLVDVDGSSNAVMSGALQEQGR